MSRIVYSELSQRFSVTRAYPSDADRLYPLYASNQEYFNYFSIAPTRERLIRDMTMLPDGCREEQKHFLVFGDAEPAAILDLIEGFPEDGVCYIGLFMVRAGLSGQGIGSEIISELCGALRARGFKSVRLAYGKRYAHAAHFWTKNGFVPLREAFLDEYGELIVAQRELSQTSAS